MQNLNELIVYYENLDTTDFPIVEPEILKKLKRNKALFLEQQTTFLEKIENLNPSAKRTIYAKS